MGIDMTTVANVEQAAAWDGPEGDRWTQNAAGYERTIRRHRDQLVTSGVVRSGDTVLDIGCGTGGLTREVVRTAHAGAALGVDLSARMLDHAREITAAQGLPNVSYEQADAQTHPFREACVDVAVSIFGASFFGDPVAAFTNIARAVRPVRSRSPRQAFRARSGSPIPTTCAAFWTRPVSPPSRPRPSRRPSTTVPIRRRPSTSSAAWASSSG